MLIEVYPGVHLDPESVDVVNVLGYTVRIFRKSAEHYLTLDYSRQEDAEVAAKNIVRKINVTLNHKRRKSRQESAR